MNICVKCRHCVRSDVGTVREGCDYNIRCSAKDGDIVACLDPVLGVPGYLMRNDIGVFVFCRTKDDALPTCRSKNPMGDCQDYEAC